MSDKTDDAWADVPTNETVPKKTVSAKEADAKPVKTGATSPAKKTFGDLRAKASEKAAAFKESLTKPAGAGASSAVAATVPVAGAPVEGAVAAQHPQISAERRTRKARLRLTRIDPWSVMKTAFLFSIAFGIMAFVAIYVVWSVVEASGLFDSVNNVLNTALGNPDGSSTFKLQDVVNTGRVLGYTALLSALNIVIITALATLFAFLYNLSATVLGGLEVTLAED